MNRISISLSLILAFSALTVTPVLADQPTVGTLAKQEEREVKNFNGVALAGPIHVVITLGATESLRFEGDAEAISTLITEVEGTTLVIRPKNSWTSWGRKYQDKKITAYVSAKSIKHLTCSSSGSIVVNGVLKSSEITTTLSGSGSISANVDVEKYTGIVSGSGSLNVAGSANSASVVLSGSGSFSKKGGFSATDLSAAVSGSGSIYANVSESIEAAISGSGSINYSGNAKVEKRVTGSGRVRKI